MKEKENELAKITLKINDREETIAEMKETLEAKDRRLQNWRKGELDINVLELSF